MTVKRVLKAAAHPETAHSWGNWYPRASITEDDCSPDPETGKYYHYFRDCQLMGCTVRQWVEEVEGVGGTKTVELEPNGHREG